MSKVVVKILIILSKIPYLCPNFYVSTVNENIRNSLGVRNIFKRIILGFDAVKFNYIDLILWMGVIKITYS